MQLNKRQVTTTSLIKFVCCMQLNGFLIKLTLTAMHKHIYLVLILKIKQIKNFEEKNMCNLCVFFIFNLIVTVLIFLIKTK